MTGRRPARRHDQGDRVPAGRQRHDAQSAARARGRRGAAAADSRATRKAQAPHAGPARRQGDRHLAGHAALRRAARPATRSRVAPSLDYEAMLAQAAGAVDDMVELTHDLRSITGGIVQRRGHDRPAGHEPRAVRPAQRHARRARTRCSRGCRTRTARSAGCSTTRRCTTTLTRIDRRRSTRSSARSRTRNGTIGKLLRDDYALHAPRRASRIERRLARQAR